MRVGDLSAFNRGWVEVNVESVSARGKLAPRLVLDLRTRTPSDHFEVVLADVRLRLFAADELVGEGQLIGEEMRPFETAHHVEVPTTHRLLRYVTTELGRDNSVQFVLRWYGRMAVRMTGDDSTVRRAGDPELGQWTDVHLPALQHEHRLPISRSDWYERVLKPVRSHDYIYLEVAVADGPGRDGWQTAMSHLMSAEKALAIGDDPAVFQHLRAIIEALPGYPKQMLSGVAEPRRGELDALLTSFGRFLHSGRHVSTVGESSGLFAVDHLDAMFAVDGAKVLLGYISKVLTSVDET